MSKIIVRTLRVGQMESNCYLVTDTSTKETIIIDSGDDGDYIITTIQSNELLPKAIIATHGHFDHNLATLELKLAYQIPFYMHKEDEFLIKKIDKSSKHFLDFDPGPPPEVDFYINKNSLLQFNKIKFKVICTPGHTPGSVCLYLEEENIIFVGDLMFSDGYYGRTDFSYSNKNDFISSLNKITSLPPKTTVYAGHGEEFMLGSFLTEK